MSKHVIRLRVREISEEKGISRTTLSRRADVNYGTVNQIWNDPYHDTSMRVLEKLARALNVPVEQLYTIEPDEQ